MRRHASDNVKYLNQSSIERLLNDDNCYSMSSGEYDEQALKERLIELKQAKAEVLASVGYDRMLTHEIVQQSSNETPVMAFKPLKTINIKPSTTKTVINTPRQWKFILKY